MKKKNTLLVATEDFINIKCLNTFVTSVIINLLHREISPHIYKPVMKELGTFVTSVIINLIGRVISPNI